MAILYSWVIGGTIRNTFHIWPRHPEVQFVWQAALTEIAGHVERQEPARATAVGGWTPETMDAPTLALLRDRPTTPLRHFNPATALVLPPGPGAIWYPTALPPAPPLRAVLAELGEPSVQTTLITGFLYEERDLASPSTPVSARFGEEVQLLGFDAGPACRPWTATLERPCTVVTYWRILTPPAGPRRLYLHLLGAGPAPLAQDDRLDAPAAWWQAGDVVLQLLSLPAPMPETAYTLRLGVYDPLTGQRLPTADGADGIVLWADAGGE